MRGKDSYLRAQFHRLRARRGAKKAIVAVAASMLTAAYHMLKNGVEYKVRHPLTRSRVCVQLEYTSDRRLRPSGWIRWDFRTDTGRRKKKWQHRWGSYADCARFNESCGQRRHARWRSPCFGG